MYLGGNDKLLNTVNSALARLSLGKEGKALVDELAGSLNRFDIKDYNDPSNTTGNDNFFSAKNPSAAYAQQIANDPSLSNFTSTPGGSGGTVYWNMQGSNSGGVWVLGGGKDNNPIINLAHEMFHGRDANRGLLYDAQYSSGIYNGLSRSEWQATYKENLIRTEMGSSLREYYFSTKDPNGNLILIPYAPRLLDTKTNIPIKPTWVPSGW